MTEARIERQHRHQRERRARRRDGKALRAAVLAADGDLDAFIGEGSQKFMKGATSQNTGAFDWQDEQEEGQEDEQG